MRTRIYYTLTNVSNGHLLDIRTTGSGGSEEPWGFCQEYILGRVQQRWEFVVPKVAFPCGWLQIQNLEIGALLSHTYLSNPPVLVDPCPTTLPTQYREAWDTQWTLIDARTYAPDSLCATGINQWCIRNRLTKAFLGGTEYKCNGLPKDVVTAMETNLLPVGGGTKFKEGINISEYTWGLELDLDNNWIIINRSSSYLLGPTGLQISSGAELTCATVEVARGRSWVLRYAYRI